MALTSKTIQLRQNGNFISPATNIESLYYEVSNDGHTVYRHSIYLHFPIGVNYDFIENNNYSVNVLTKSKNYISLKKEDIILDATNKDIMVSSIKTRRIPGTNFQAIDVSNYNLSELLFSYAPKYWIDVSVKPEIINYITLKTDEVENDCALYINEYNNKISYLYNYIDTTVLSKILNIESSINLMEESIFSTFLYTRALLLELKNASRLVPGKAYFMTYNPTEDARAIFTEHIFNIFLLATSTSDFDCNVLKCCKYKNDLYFSNSDLSKWEVSYNIDTNTIYYMKDEWNNECPYDFKNKRFKIGESGSWYYLHTFNVGSNAKDHSITGKCTNNKINTKSCVLGIYADTGEICNNIISNSNFIYICFYKDITNNNILSLFDMYCAWSSVINLTSIPTVNNNTVGNNNEIILRNITNFNNNNIGSNNTNVKIVGEFNIIGSNNVGIYIEGNYNRVGSTCSSLYINGNLCEIKTGCIDVSVSGNTYRLLNKHEWHYDGEPITFLALVKNSDDYTNIGLRNPLKIHGFVLKDSRATTSLSKVTRDLERLEIIYVLDNKFFYVREEYISNNNDIDQMLHNEDADYYALTNETLYQPAENIIIMENCNKLKISGNNIIIGLGISNNTFDTNNIYYSALNFIAKSYYHIQ